MRIGSTRIHGVRVIEPLDRVTVGQENARQFESEVLDATVGEALVVLDASRIVFFESDGVDSLLEFHRQAAARNGRFVLSGLNEAVSEVFRISGLDCLFRIYPDADLAAREVAKDSGEPERWH